METIESTATALANSLVVDETPASETDMLAEQLMTEPEPAAQGEAQPQTETQEAAGAAETTEPEGSAGEGAAHQEETPEAARMTAIKDGIRALNSAGWGVETLTAFAADEQVRADIAAGKSVAEAANAYAARVMAGGKAASKGKSGPPAIHRAAAAEAKPQLSIDDMTDEQFDAFSKKARELAQMGHRVRM